MPHYQTVDPLDVLCKPVHVYRIYPGQMLRRMAGRKVKVDGRSETLYGCPLATVNAYRGLEVRS